MGVLKALLVSEPGPFVVFMNTFMNLVKRSLEVGVTRGGLEASGGVEASVGALLLPALDPLAGVWLASSSSSPARSTGVLTQGLRRVVRDLGAITKV